jgi:hypothetical protein
MAASIVFKKLAFENKKAHICVVEFGRAGPPEPEWNDLRYRGIKVRKFERVSPETYRYVQSLEQATETSGALCKYAHQWHCFCGCSSTLVACVARAITPHPFCGSLLKTLIRRVFNAREPHEAAHLTIVPRCRRCRGLDDCSKRGVLRKLTFVTKTHARRPIMRCGMQQLSPACMILVSSPLAKPRLTSQRIRWWSKESSNPRPPIPAGRLRSALPLPWACRHRSACFVGAACNCESRLLC